LTIHEAGNFKWIGINPDHSYKTPILSALTAISGKLFDIVGFGKEAIKNF